MEPDELPLFPLSSVLLPDGRISLQVFEQRYLDLVKDCLRRDSVFGVVRILKGGEVDAGVALAPELAGVGCSARIVDWDQLPNGLLGITAQGEQRFRIDSHSRQDNGLNVARVEWLEPFADSAIADDCDELLGLLESLEEHPGIRRMGPWEAPESCAELGSRLAQLLPVSEEQRYRFLLIDDALERLSVLGEILVELQE